MPASFPKPHKPNVFASVERTVINGVNVWDDSWFPEDNYTRPYRNSTVTAYGRRGYASSPPGKFRQPSGYLIYGSEYHYNNGRVLWEHTRRPASLNIQGTYHRGTETFPNLYESQFFDLTGEAKSMPILISNQLNTELLNKIGNRSANYGESIGEARSTISHLAKTASSLTRAILAARKGNWGGVAKALGVSKRKLRDGTSVSERWLEYQFGWLPLMGDIYDTHKLIRDGLAKRNTIMSSVRTISRTNSFQRGDMKFSGLQCNESVSYRAKCYYTISDSYISSLNNLGLINPLEVAWALVPFSFVVDWVVPVGNFLQGITDRCGVNFVGGYYGVRAEASALWKPQPDDVYSCELKINSITVQQNLFSYRRTPMSGLPLPGLYIKNPLSTNHALSALALIKQLTR